MEMVMMERLTVICPACGQRVEAVASDGRVKGYCAVAKQFVDFLIEKQPVAEIGVEVSKGLLPVKGNRDSRGRFVKGNVPVNKKS